MGNRSGWLDIFRARRPEVKPSGPVEPAPDHDFHNGWGCTYGGRRGDTGDDGNGISRLWQEYTSDTAAAGRKYHLLLDEYTTLFHRFFQGYYPISLHAHASDALQPTTIASLIMSTAATSPLVLHSSILAPKPDERPEETGKRVHKFALDLLGWNETHVRAPNFVYETGGYGAGYGPLAHASKEWEINAIASGPKPVLAKAQGCIAAVIDLVSTDDGSVLPPERFSMLKASCARHGLLLIVDETMTAIRCGAPFAFQRSEYALPNADLLPDLGIFGKGLGVSGIAMKFNGALVKRLAHAEPADMEQTIRYWRALVSRPIALPILIEAYGTLRSAEAEDWPARSIRIEDAIRDTLHELEPSTKEPGVIRGLAAVIAIDKRFVKHFGIMGAIRRRSHIVRWLPKLGSAYADHQALMGHVFGPQSRKHRQHHSVEADQSGAAPL